MRKLFLLATAPFAMAACAPIETDSENYAVVCDDAKEPDCAPDRKVVVE